MYNSLSLLLLLIPFSSSSSSSSSAVPETCKDGLDAFCKCHQDIASKHPALCNSIVKQCKKSFCNPLCLRMAWKPTIDVKCELAPEWKECRDFILPKKNYFEKLSRADCKNLLGQLVGRVFPPQQH